MLLESSPLVRILVARKHHCLLLNRLGLCIILRLNGGNLLFLVDSDFLIQQAFVLDDVNVILHTFMLGQHNRRVLQSLNGKHLLLLAVVVAAKIHPLLAVELLLWLPIRAKMQFIIQRAEELLNESVRVLTVEVVRTCVPAAVV